MIRPLLLTLGGLALAWPGPARAQCYSTYSTYSYRAPTYTYYSPPSYTPYYVPVAVAYPLNYYGSSYSSDTGTAKELADLKRELQLEKLKQEVAALKATPAVPPVPAQQAPAYTPPQRQAAPPAPAPDYPETEQAYDQPQEPAYAPPAQRSYQPPTQAPPRRQAAPPQPDYGQQPPRHMPRATSRAPRSRGQIVGQQSCASCHSPSQADDYGRGMVFFSDDEGLQWSLRPRQVDRVIAAVKGGHMPPKDSGHALSAADRAALVQHLTGIKQRFQTARRDD